MLLRFKENKLFQILTPILSLLMIGVIEGLMYKPYVNWVGAAVGACYAALYICVAAFTFWLALTCVKEPKLKFVWILWGITTVVAVAVHMAGMAIVNFTVKNTVAYVFGTVLLDVLLVFGAAYGAAKISDSSLKKAAIAVVSATLAIVICGVCVITALVGKDYNYKAQTYAVNEFTVNGALSDGGNKPVKVVLLGGQSNASGVCHTEYLTKDVSEEKLQEYLVGYPSVLINYFNDNGNNTSNGYFVRTGLNQGYNCGFFGPELGMAEVFAEEYPEETVIVLKYAWGGSNLYNQWLSPSSDGETGVMYTAFVNFVTTSMKYLVDKNYDAEIVAMCWMQGESDSFDVYADQYLTNQTNLIKDLRAELSEYIADDGMYFVDAGISDSEYWKEYQKINAAKVACADADPLTVYIDTSDLEYKNQPENNPDLAHFDAGSGIKLGNRFAKKIVELIK